MKLISFRKIGTVLAITVFGFISFTAGVDLTQNANSAGSSSALPVNKGGTGQNNLANVMGVGSANKLATARTLSGVAFDGTRDINLPYKSQAVWGGGSPMYLKFTGFSEWYTSTFYFDIIVSSNRAAHAIFTTYRKEPPTVKQLYIGTNVADTSFMYYLHDNTTYYFRVNSIGGEVLQYYLASQWSTAGTKVSNAEEIEMLSNAPWMKFDIIRQTNETPLNP
jgi:hypothetical protein